MYENCIYLESPIVNKFKKTTTLYHAALFHKGDKTLNPSPYTVGNNKEPRIFFFSKQQYAINSLLGSAAQNVYQTYLANYIEEVKKHANPDDFRDFVRHCQLLRSYGLTKVAPLNSALSRDAKIYHLDDRGACILPICYEYKNFLKKQNNTTVYIYECEVDSSKIKRGNNGDPYEVAVFEPVEVKKIHEYTLGELVGKASITTVPFSKVDKYTKMLNPKK